MTRFIATALALAIVSVSVASPAFAGRAERSAENRAKADAWCERYVAENPGARCSVKRMGGLCPRGMKAGKRYNKIRANGYKTCVAGNKLGQFIKDIHDPRKATDLAIRGQRGSILGTVDAITD
jgi:hypothetical protein